MSDQMLSYLYQGRTELNQTDLEWRHRNPAEVRSRVPIKSNKDAVASPRGENRTTSPPPPRITDRTPHVRSMQIWGDFNVGKNGSTYRYMICSHVYLHAPMLRWTFFALTITKKEGVVEVVERVTLVGPQQSCGALWDLSVLAWALQSISLFWPSLNIGSGTNQMSFQFLTEGRYLPIG